MKKGVFAVILLLLAGFVGAQQTNYDDHEEVMKRFTYVETDNVHIVRIKNIADKLEGELDGLQSEITTLKAEVNELNSIKAEIRKEDPAVANKLDEINAKLSLMDSNIKKVKEVKVIQPVVMEPPSYFGYDSLPLLVGLFVILLTSVAVGSAMMKIQPKKETLSEVESFIEKSLSKKHKVHHIKHNLLVSGWKPSEIEHEFKKLKKKKPELF